MLSRVRAFFAAGQPSNGGQPQGSWERVFVPGPDPIGSATALRWDALMGIQNVGLGGVPPAYGPTGDPSRRFDGQLAVDQDFSAVNGRPVGAIGVMSSGLPSSKVPSRSLLASPAWSVAAQFGVRPGSSSG